jgi:predicted dehydrogenase
LLAVLLRGAVLGLGSIGRHHGRILRDSPRVHFVGAVEVNGFDGGLEPEQVHRSLDGLLATETVDFAIVALPTALHEEASVTLAELGINLLVEKPLALTLPAARAIVAACSRAQVHGAVGHVERYNPAVAELKRLLGAGAIGSPLAVVSERAGPLPNGRARDAGVVSDLATHDLDLIPWLVGEPIRALSAQTSRRVGCEHEHLAAVTGRLTDGTVFNTTVDWLSPQKTRRIRVVGEEGTLVGDALATTLVRVGEDVVEIPLRRAEPLAVQMDSFCDLILGDSGAPVVTLADGVRAVACADAVLRSAREQCTISL